MKYISHPIVVEAEQFKPDGTNAQELVTIVKLHKGEARWVYLDKDGNESPNLTTKKGIVLRSYPGGPLLPVLPGDFIILNAKGEFYNVPEKDFREYHTTSWDEIGDGDMTFGLLYKMLNKLAPPLEQILVSDKVEVPEELSAREFLQANGTRHTDSDGIDYYVVNGKVFIF